MAKDNFTYTWRMGTWHNILPDVSQVQWLRNHYLGLMADPLSRTGAMQVFAGGLGFLLAPPDEDKTPETRFHPLVNMALYFSSSISSRG